ncbi:hypothetical protein SAMN05216320_109179 [Duganella sp. OV458]|nr:hypothetical protein SAMN05216320_109179 [Duganella sp. OV458]SDK19028.1 hypothetical protein SAMN05428973_109103 [Duganella sp. OV510]
MTMFWNGWDVRVDAAQAWMHLAQRNAATHPIILDRVAAVLEDPVATVRLQAAGDIAIIGNSSPERMWEMAERIAAQETNAEVLASFLCSLRHFSHAAPERCETLLNMIMTRWAEGLIDENSGGNHLSEALGNWIAQLFIGQARDYARDWLTQWAVDPLRFSNQLHALIGVLRASLFLRYAPPPEAETSAMSDRAQQAVELIISSAIRIASDAHATAILESVSETDKQQAIAQFQAAEAVILHTVNQFYFGSGAFGENGIEDGPGLRDAATMTRFLTDYSSTLAMLADTRTPEALHHLIELYQFLIPANPSAVFGVVHAILLGRGEQEGYHYETLAIDVVVGIVRRYLADYRAIFEDEARRQDLVAILNLFADAGWPDALQLLYDLPDLLR